jgi:hypothetical protein
VTTHIVNGSDLIRDSSDGLQKLKNAIALFEVCFGSIAPNTARVLRRRMSVAPRKRQSAAKMRPVVKGQSQTSANRPITSSAAA